MRDLIMIVLTPAALTCGAIVGSIRNRLSPRDDLGLQRPRARDAIVYTVLFALLMAMFELLYWRSSGDAAPSDWRARYSGAALYVRVVFAAAIYPLAEELFFRGFLLGLIRKKARVLIAVLATSIAFTALHSLGGSWLGALQIFTDGVFFATVRVRSGSLYLPMAFHVIGNSIAMWQRLT